MTEEYLKNDHLSVSVKYGLSEEIKSAYRVFGWQLEEERKDKRYSNFMHMKFVRDHKIEGKDRLQLLQVRFDLAINFVGKAGSRMCRRALCTGVILGLLGVALILFGSLFLFYLTTNLSMAFGVTLISSGVVFLILCVLAAIRLYSHDKRIYSGMLAVIAENIRSTVKEASIITGILPEGGVSSDALAESVAEGALPPEDGEQEDAPAKIQDRESGDGD